ncbi:MAG: hypothetical protein QOG49_1263 [Frankiaceae bacterium]|nr:hypothetical protein [Frankiaceae bacterium]
MVELPFPGLRRPPDPTVPLSSVLAGVGDGWREAAGQDANALPVHVQWDPLAASLAPVAGFDIQVAVAVPLVVAGDDGLPTPAEERRLVDVGEAVRASIERAERARLVLVITTAGVREYVGYSDDDAWLAGWAAEITAAVSGAQVMSRRDPGWTTLLHSIP